MNDEIKICDRPRRGRAEPVQVWCDTYRCLAYMDDKGRWFDYYKGTPLTGTVRIVEFKEEN